MYHHASSTFMTMMQNALPSPEWTGDSDSDNDIAQELNQKRRQLDDEVARFQALKDNEFRDFEAELRSRRQYRRSNAPKNNAVNYYTATRPSPSATPPSTSMLTGYTKKAQSPRRSPSMKHSQPICLIKPNAGPKVTTPTIALDKLNIKGENIPPSQTSPICAATLPRHISGGYLLPSEVEKHEHDERSVSSAGTTHHVSEKSGNDPFTGLRSHKYLTVLDPRVCSPGEDVEGTQTEPASPAEPSFVIESVAVHSSSMPTESSVPETFQVPSTKRAYTSPTPVNRRTLPPIIRNVNGRKRASSKRKRVTFQLADRAIVQPSSSYEEGPSPDEDDASPTTRTRVVSAAVVADDTLDGGRPLVQRQTTPMDPFGRRLRNTTPIETPEEEIGMSMADLLLGSTDSKMAEGYFSPRASTSQADPSPSPEHPATFNTVDENAYLSKRKTVLDTQPRRNSKSPQTSPNASRQPSIEALTPQTGSKPPHFSPHHSPVTRPLQRQYLGMIEDELLAGQNNVGFFELDEEMSSPKVGPPETEEDSVEERDRLRDHDEASDFHTGTSVPINIIRPSSITSSWVGTFGH